MKSAARAASLAAVVCTAIAAAAYLAPKWWLYQLNSKAIEKSKPVMVTQDVVETILNMPDDDDSVQDGQYL